MCRINQSIGFHVPSFYAGREGIAAGNLPERKTNLLPLVKTLKSSDYLKVKDGVLVHGNRVHVRGYIDLLMRPFFAFLGLLLCLIPIRADEQLVIKDFEAIRNVGRYVEVCGLVVSVTISPFGTAYINFGREYPNQSFAGFVASDSGIKADQITKLQGKNIGIVGTIELRKGKPEIKIMSIYQIVVLSSKLAE